MNEFFKAAQEGNLEEIKTFIQQNVDINIQDNDGNTALMLAAREGHLDVAKQLIANNSDIDLANNDGYTALIFAAREGHLDVVKELTENGSDVNIANKYGNTALIFAANYGSLDIVKELLNRGSNLLLVHTLIHTKGNPETQVLNELLTNLKAKALFDKLFYDNFEGLNSLGKLQLLRAFNFMENNYDKFKEFYSEKYIKGVKGFLEVFEPLEALTKEFLEAAKEGNLYKIQTFIQQNIDVNIKDEDGNTPLMLAAKFGNLKVVKQLIANKADINKANDDGNTALIEAIMSGQLEVVKELTANSADVNIANKYGDTPLTEASKNGYLEIIKDLLNSGSDLLLVHTKENSETLVLNTLLSNSYPKLSFDKLPRGNFEGLNSLAKLQMLRAFNFMENNYYKFKEFYSEKHIKEVKASLEAFNPLETLINELTDTSLLDFSTAENRHKLESSINHLKHILGNKAKYKSEGIAVNQAKIKEFQNNCKVAAGSKYYEFTQSTKNIGLKVIFDKYFKENLENFPGHIDLPKPVYANIFEKVLISNKEAKDNHDASVVEKKLPCATNMFYDLNTLKNHIEELGTISKLYE